MDIFNETILQILQIYKKHSAGGALHIVLDDGNTESHHIQWCLDNSIPEIENIKERELFEKCAKNLLKMSEKKRNKCITQAFKHQKTLKDWKTITWEDFILLALLFGLDKNNDKNP